MYTHEGVHIVAALVAKTGSHLGPINAQLFRADHGQRSFYALPHIHAVAQYGGGAVFGNGHKRGRLLGRFLTGLHFRSLLGVHVQCGKGHEGQPHDTTQTHGDKRTARQRCGGG